LKDIINLETNLDTSGNTSGIPGTLLDVVMEKINWDARVRNEETLQRVKKARSIVQTTKKKER
jgi:hypothetical protein